MSFKLTPYGRREIAIAGVVATAAMVAIIVLAAKTSWWALAALAPVAALWAWVLVFFRDPERMPPDGAWRLVSAADGRVADITNIGPQSILGRDGVQIGVFMNVVNVHVNRSPCDGVVESIEHRSGTFMDVRDPVAAEWNESATIRLLCRFGGAEFPVVVRQVAGLVARRIITDLSLGQNVARGQRIGMIKFGSRLELLVPRELAAKVCVRIGECVKAGESVLVEAPQAQENRR